MIKNKIKPHIALNVAVQKQENKKDKEANKKQTNEYSAYRGRR